MSNKRILAALLAFVIVACVFSGCSSRTRGGSDPSDSSSSSSKNNTKKNDGTVASITPDYLPEVAEHLEENSDTVGWLTVPGTSIDDVVVCNYENNSYYMRKNFYKEYSFNGVYYADRRSSFGDGSREQIGANICIYGHAMTDIPEQDNYQIKFGPLHDFRDPDYARDMPYIFFSTEKENLAYEVFAVFVVNSDNADIPYNNGSVSQADFVKMVREEILPRSKYNYDVEIKDSDKFLTLSTCIYTLDNGYFTNYPDTYMRYVVMAKLVDPKEKIKEQASFTINEDVIIDKDGKLHS